MSQSKTVLVTGALGFLGRYTAKRFHQEGFQVYGLGHGVPKDNELSDWGIDAWFEVPKDRSLNVTDLIAAKEKWNIDTFDVIFHAASVGSVGFSRDHPEKANSLSVQSTKDVLDFMTEHSPRAHFIFPSSGAVYGAVENKPITESDLLKPASVYGEQKVECESLIKTYSGDQNIKATVIRFFSLYGPYLYKQLLWDVSRRVLIEEQNPLTLFGTGAETRDFIYIEDAVDLIWTISQSDHDGHFEVFNGGFGEATRIDALAKKFAGHLAEIDIAFNNQTREGDPKHFWANMTLAQEKLDWSPKYNLDQGLSLYADWVKSEIS